MSGKCFLLGMEARLSCIARHWPFLRILARLLAGSTVGGAQAFHSPAITDDVFDLDLAKVSTRWQSVHLLSEQIPPLAQAHRRLLLMAMLQAGFAPMPSEWRRLLLGRLRAATAGDLWSGLSG